MNPVHTLKCFVVKIRFNAYSYHLLLCLSSGLFVPGFRTRIMYEAFMWHIRAKRTAHLILLEMVVAITRYIQTLKPLIMRLYRARFHFVLLRSSYLPSALLARARSMYSTHRMVD